MAAPTVEAIQEKVEKNLELTPEEMTVVKSIPNEEPRPKPPEEVFGEKVQIDPAAKEEAKKAEEDKKAAEDKAKAEEVAKREADEKESRTKVERDVEKPIDRVDLSKYTDKERSLFFELRAARRRAQEAEADRDKLKFEKLQREAAEKLERERAEKTPKETPTPEDDGEFVTAKRAKELATDAAEKAAKKARDEAIAEANDKHSRTLLALMTTEVKAKYDDAVDTLAQAEILKGDQDADAVLRAAAEKGENLALVTYHLVKSSPKYKPVEKSPDPDAQARAKRIEENENKPRTMGAGSGGAAAASEDSMLRDILSMDPEDYAKLPKAKRQAILKKYGV